MRTSLSDAVGDVLREAAEVVVLPRFKALAEQDVRLKGSAELVTVADEQAEQMISRSLKSLLPEARVVGEEACAHDPSMLEDLADGLVWVIDPIDGTAHYAAGRAPFAMMVALLDCGEFVGSWILDPLSGRLARAERGGGAWIDGERVQATSTNKPLDQMRGVVSQAFVPPARAAEVQNFREAVAEASPSARCAGHEYPLVALGQWDFAIYWRTLVWDHAAGTLFLSETGGRVCHLDGAEYRPTHPREGLLLAGNPLIAEQILAQFTGHAPG